MPFPQDDNLYRVLEAIAESPLSSQRDLARRSGLSLGLVNLILGRLVRTGRLKVSALNRRKVRYFLTPKGLSEKMDRAYAYLLRTCRVFQSALERVESVVVPLATGRGRFVIVGEGEIAGMVEMALFRRGIVPSRIVRRPEAVGALASGDVCLDCRWGRQGGALGVSVLERILEAGLAGAEHP